MEKIAQNPRILKLFQKSPVIGVYLYGSKVLGKPSRLSDLDIGILLSDKVMPKDYFKIRLEVQDALGKILKKETIDLAILNEVSPLLAQEIVTKGKLIFCLDKDKVAKFACKTLKRYDDSCFLRETYYQYLKERAKKGALGEQKR